MNELGKFLPTPPQIGPPLPRILQARWPWLRQPPQRQYVLPIREEPEVVVESPKTETAPASTPATLHRASEYEVECPPELLHELTPIRIDPSWLQAQ